jgi:hypothetical protein
MEGERCGSQLGRYCSTGLKCIGQTDGDNGYGKCHYTGNLHVNFGQLVMIVFVYKYIGRLFLFPLLF